PVAIPAAPVPMIVPKLATVVARLTPYTLPWINAKVEPGEPLKTRPPFSISTAVPFDPFAETVPKLVSVAPPPDISTPELKLRIDALVLPAAPLVTLLLV